VVADEILSAMGRDPALKGLGLEKTGVKVVEGKLKIADTMATNVPHIFAAGDVTGLHEVVHIAIQQGEWAARNAVRLVRKSRKAPERSDYRLKALVAFTEPEIASVGLTEQEAKEQKIDYLTAQYPFNDHGKSQIKGADFGFVKLIAEKKRGEIIGAEIIGPHAADLIHELIAVMRYRGTVQELAAMPHYHPTLAEIITYPAEEIADELAKKK
jgi:pyruvate/2-oxoglutarate dehydrogenase complex dihydrolipoamide dehydrogenase (E3) component